MINVHATLGADTTVTLRQALLVYQAQHGEQGFVSIHPVQHHEDGASLGAGRLMTTGDLRSLIQSLCGSQGITYLPPHVIAHGPNALAWYEPAQVRPLFFRTRDTLLNALSGRAYPQPPLLFIASDTTLRVYALPEDTRPTLDTHLMVAPYYNTNQGRVCLGSMPLPAQPHPNDTRAYSDAFFGSNFTHPSGPERLYGTWEGSYGELWQHVASTGVFPSMLLQPTRTTVAEALRC